MKVVFSQRLRDILNDPKAAEQLEDFLASASLGEPSNIKITVKDSSGKTIRYVPRLVRIFGPSATSEA